MRTFNAISGVLAQLDALGPATRVTIAVVEKPAPAADVDVSPAIPREPAPEPVAEASAPSTEEEPSARPPLRVRSSRLVAAGKPRVLRVETVSLGDDPRRLLALAITDGQGRSLARILLPRGEATRALNMMLGAYAAAFDFEYQRSPRRDPAVVAATPPRARASAGPDQDAPRPKGSPPASFMRVQGGRTR